jgi:hypothetical protein
MPAKKTSPNGTPPAEPAAKPALWRMSRRERMEWLREHDPERAEQERLKANEASRRARAARKEGPVALAVRVAKLAGQVKQRRAELDRAAERLVELEAEHAAAVAELEALAAAEGQAAGDGEGGAGVASA